MAATTQCNKCRHWSPEFEDAPRGFCRRWAPHSNLRWVLTYQTDGCGEFATFPKKKSEEDSELNTMTKDLIAFYCEEFEGIYGKKPNILGKDTGCAKLLVKQHGYDRARWIVGSFLEDPPSYNADHLMLDLRYIPQAANKIIARG